MSSVRSPMKSWSDRFQTRSSQRKREPSESSWLLRVLAQMLVVIGILATDTAAETSLSLWAIPASFLGAYWSWRNRDKRNITVKFLLAIGMMAALILFFRDLIFGRQLNDTRLVLAQLLVQVQVLHSFDLPRRKDLGYSMVIGLILTSVACTLSQTMAFGLWLLLFLAIALPVLVMDYRSRLGFKTWQWPVNNDSSKRRQFTGILPLFGTIVALGLLIFAFMPRLPGYQIQTFPVSTPIETQGKFDNEQVINPGYIDSGRGGNGQARPGQGRSPSSGQGQLDENYYYGFGSRINQNLRGQLKEQIVMRVRSQAEGFWRVMAFDQYTGQGWEVSRNDDTRTIDRRSWSYKFFLPHEQRLNRVQRVVQTYTMVGDLPNVIPAMDQAKEIFFPTQEIAIDTEDGLRSPVPLTEGLTYTVLSDVPYRDRTVLQKAKSIIPRSRKQKSAPNPYTEIEPELKTKLKSLAEEMLAQANTPITSDYEKALFLTQALKQRYTLKLDVPFLEKDEDLIESFLFKQQGGYPDHFATTLTMMLRSIGLSTRLVTGFAPGEFNPFTGYYVVKNTDAYAMTEVYLNKYGWFAFDPIPGHPLIPPSIEESQTFGALKSFWKWVAGWLPSPVTGWLTWAVGGIFRFIGGVIGQFLSLFRQGWFGWFIGILSLTATAFAGWLSWLGYRRWQYWRSLKHMEPTARLYQQLTDWLGEQGIPKHPAQTPLEYANIVQTQTAPQVNQTTHRITAAYLAWRYGGETVNLANLQTAFKTLQRQQRQQWPKQLQQFFRSQLQRRSAKSHR